MNQNYGLHIFESQILNITFTQIPQSTIPFSTDFAYPPKKQQMDNYTQKSLNYTWFAASIVPKIMFA